MSVTHSTTQTQPNIPDQTTLDGREPAQNRGFQNLSSQDGRIYSVS